MYKPFDLTGKVALVTGGNSGIGLGMARAVAEAGADVAIWGTNAAKNAAAEAELAKSGRKVRAFACDVSDEKAVEAAFAETLRVFSRVDGCFANAGVSGRGTKSFLEMSGEEWHRVLKVNLDGAQAGGGLHQCGCCGEVQGCCPGVGANGDLGTGEVVAVDGAGLGGDKHVAGQAIQTHGTGLGGDVGGHRLGHLDQVSDVAAHVVVVSAA